MRAILSAPGSRGDVNPMIAIGGQLRQLGFEVVISLAEPYAEVAQSAGLIVEPVVNRERFAQLLSNANFWKPIRGARAVFREMAAEYLPLHDAVIRKYHQSGNTILVSHPLDLASRVYRDHDPSTPLVDIHLAPTILRTYDAPPRLSPWWFEISRPTWLLRTAYWLVDRVAIDPVVATPLNRLRDQYTLPPVRRIVDQWWLSPDRILAMYPDWFAPATQSFSPRLVHCGFPLRDLDNQNVPPPTNRPIVFTAGTAHHHSREFFSRAAAACDHLEHPGLLVSTHADNFPTKLSPLVGTMPYVSFSKLLPHCAAIIHHGGIGTTSQALAAAVPQLVRPMAYDQFDNATRVEQLGCGRWLKSDRSLAMSLARLLADESLQQRCRQIASRLDRRDAVELAAGEIHNLFLTHHPPQ